MVWAARRSGVGLLLSNAYLDESTELHCLGSESLLIFRHFYNGMCCGVKQIEAQKEKWRMNCLVGFYLRGNGIPPPPQPCVKNHASVPSIPFQEGSSSLAQCFIYLLSPLIYGMVKCVRMSTNASYRPDVQISVALLRYVRAVTILSFSVTKVQLSVVFHLRTFPSQVFPG